MSATPGPPPRHALWALVIVVCALAPYLRALEGGFVWTDHHFVENNRSLQTWSTLPRLFVTDAWQVGGDQRTIGYYRPTRNLTLLLDTKLFGVGATGYHFTNLVIHALCSLLVYAVVWAVFAHPLLAGLSAVLFAVHPVHIETVAWIIGRTDSCAALGYLFALYAWLRAFADRTRWGWWCLGCVGAVWALLAKESAATLPAAMALCLWFRNGEQDRRIVPLVVRCAPAAVLTVVYLVVRGAILTSITNHPMWGGSIWTNALTAVSLLGQYARMLVAGRPLIAVYEEHIRTSPADPAVLAGLGVAALVVATAFMYRRVPRLAFGAAWLGMATLPVLHILPFKVLLAERFMYLPSVGWCVTLAAGITALVERQRIAGVLCALAVTVGYGAATVQHVPAWRDDFTLFQDSLDKAPNSTEAVMGLARAHYDAEQFAEARKLYRRATDLSPEYYLAWYNRGLTHAELGESREAFEALRRATKTNAASPDGWWAYGRAAYAVGEVTEAARALGILAAQRPTGEAYLYWGRALARSDDWSAAAETFVRAIRGGARDPHFAAEAGNALIKAGQEDAAEEWLVKARAVGPSFRRDLQQEAVQAGGSNPDHALYMARVALRLGPDDANARNLYIQFARVIQPQAALRVAAAYAATHPADVPARAQYVRLLLEQRALPEAREAAMALATDHPDAPRALLMYAAERRAAGDLESAVDTAFRAAALAPQDVQMAMYAGDIALEADVPARAIAAFERAKTLSPTMVPVLRGLGRAYHAAGRPADAAAVLREGLALAPDDAQMVALLDAIQRDAARGRQ